MSRYKVHVLYFINPFLMWVEMLEKRTAEKVFFEQIGIFGLIPMSGNPLSDPTMSRRVSREYDYLAVDRVLQKHFDNAEIWFTPRFEQRGYSLFNKNIHKLGYLKAVYPDGRIVDLRHELLVSGLATYNEHLFMKCLKKGTIKPKLKIKLALNTCFFLDAACRDKDIETLWLRCLRRQTSRVRSQVRVFGGRFYQLVQPIRDIINIPQQEEKPEPLAITDHTQEQECEVLSLSFSACVKQLMSICWWRCRQGLQIPNNIYTEEFLEQAINKDTLQCPWSSRDHGHCKVSDLV